MPTIELVHVPTVSPPSPVRYRVLLLGESHRSCEALRAMLARTNLHLHITEFPETADVPRSMLSDIDVMVVVSKGYGVFAAMRERLALTQSLPLVLVSDEGRRNERWSAGRPETIHFRKSDLTAPILSNCLRSLAHLKVRQHAGCTAQNAESLH